MYILPRQTTPKIYSTNLKIWTTDKPILFPKVIIDTWKKDVIDIDLNAKLISGLLPTIRASGKPIVYPPQT